MGAPRTGACSPWATSDDLCAPCTGSGPVPTSEQFQIASDVLFELSGHRFPGECTATVRPCGRLISDDGPMVYTDVSSGLGGSGPGWGSIGISQGCSCNSGRACGCNRPDEVTLGGWPVTAITQVKIDGDIVDPDTYRIDDYRYLVRLPELDGSRPGWPCCQDVALEDTEAGTWSVSFAYGVAPPPAGVMAAASLACQIALACSGDGGCVLPKRVTNITRQGISMTVLDPFDFLDNGRVGIYEVDALFLNVYGPKRKQRLATQIVNPDIHRSVRRAGT